MTYLTTVFPDHISRGATGGPTWASTVVYTGGGQRYTNQQAVQALRRYDVSHAARKATLFATLLAYFHACRGPLHSFPFKDWTDYTVTSAQGRFVMLTSTTFQMYRRYSAGGVNHDRKIIKPLSGTVTVTGGSSPSVNYATGVVTVSSGTPSAWAGEFYVPCCFEIDGFKGEIIDGTIEKRILGWSGISIVETRNP